MRTWLLRRWLCSTSLCLLAVIVLPGSASARKTDPLMELLREELDREMKGLAKEETPPYFIGYSVRDVRRAGVSASFGSLIGSHESHSRTLSVTVRVGTYARDNMHEIRGSRRHVRASRSSSVALPLTDDPLAVRAVIWRETDRQYRRAVERLAQVKANVAVKVAEEDTSDDFSREPNVARHYEPPLSEARRAVDLKSWQRKVKQYSVPFLQHPLINAGQAAFTYSTVRKVMVTTEGTQLAHNQSYARVFVSGRIKSDDGMELPLYKNHFAFQPDRLPSDERILADARAMVKKLVALREADLATPYTGPAILAGRAAAVFFHEILGHRVEGHRQKSEDEGQTFKKKIGEEILPASMRVLFDPTRTELGGQDLAGHYRFDDEGIAARPVSVVEKGVLKTFLMSRQPIDNFPSSNGHGRSQQGYLPVARQSNMLIETMTPIDDAELRRRLLAEVKQQGKEFGLEIRDIQGGFTFTGRSMPNAFKLTPIEVYRVYVDGRPDELIRGVDLVGTPLVMFSMIEAATKRQEIFNGMCGAESGSVPVAAAAPAMLIKQVEVQRKAKSQDLPPLLPRPDTERSSGTDKKRGRK